MSMSPSGCGHRGLTLLRRRLLRTVQNLSVSCVNFSRAVCRSQSVILRATKLASPPTVITAGLLPVAGLHAHTDAFAGRMGDQMGFAANRDDFTGGKRAARRSLGQPVRNPGLSFP